jgi:hypothetical protein
MIPATPGTPAQAKQRLTAVQRHQALIAARAAGEAATDATTIAALKAQVAALAEAVQLLAEVGSERPPLAVQPAPTPAEPDAGE